MTVGNEIQTYSGQGKLTFADGNHIHCDFECAQLPNARIPCSCFVRNVDTEHFKQTAAALGTFTDAEQLQGQTDEGASLLASQLRHVSSKPHWKVDESYILLSFLAREMEVRRTGRPESASLMRFGLTNLEFLGTNSYVRHRADGARTWRLELPVDIVDQQVIIRPLDDYTERMSTVKTLRAIDVTCEAMVELGHSETQESVVALLDDLCLLLSLAKGCLIQWIYYQLCSESGTVLKTYHRDAVTKPYSPLPLIPSQPAEDLSYFVERTFDRFGEQKGWWDLRKTILGYVDARLEQDFLESRGLKLAIVMDYLETRYLSQLGKTTVLREAVFGAQLNTLHERVSGVLRDVFPEATDNEIALMAKHTQGLKYYPLRQALREMFGELGLGVSSDELQRFMDNRNKLVHYGEFRSKDYPQEYRFMIAFVDKVLLAILAYDGYYYDWTQPPGWIGRDMEMRMKLDLDSSKNGEP